MLIRARDNLRSTWKQVTASTAAALPLLSASQQTMSTWAKPVDAYTAVPGVFQSFFESRLASGKEFPYTVLTPAQAGFFSSTAELLVCDLGDQLAILERDGSSFEAHCYPYRDISHVEVSRVLLDSRIKICGLTGSGIPACSIIRFNTIGEYLFAPLLEKMRMPSNRTASAGPASPQDMFAGWSLLNFKLMNYARSSLLAGEPVIQAVLQPEIRSTQVTILGKTFYRTLAPALACVLTGWELILIREDIRQAGGRRYGGIWDFIPLDKISKISLNTKDDRLPVLSIHLPGGAALEYTFQNTLTPEIERLLQRTRARA